MKSNNKKINNSNDDFELPNYDEKYKDLDYEYSNSQQQTRNKNNNLKNSNNNNNFINNNFNNNNNSNNHNNIYKKPIVTSPQQQSKKTLRENDSIVDDISHANPTQDKIVDDDKVSYSPTPPTFKDSVRRSPNSSKYKYVNEEIEDDDSNNNDSIDSEKNKPITPPKPLSTKQQPPTNIFKLTKQSQLLKDEIKVDDEDDIINTDSDEDEIITNDYQSGIQQTPNKSQFDSSLKNNKWLGNLMSKNTNPTDHNTSTHSTPTKQLKLNKNHVRGGLVEKLSKALNKKQYCMDIYSRKSNITINAKSTLPNHFKRDLNVIITELPSLLQPHVYVTICKCTNWVDNNEDNTTTTKFITVLFPMTAKTELKLKLGSHVTVEYWQLVQSDKSITILSHISHSNTTSTTVVDGQDSLLSDEDKLSSALEILLIKQPQSDLLKSQILKKNETSHSNTKKVDANNPDESIDYLILNNETTELEKISQNSVNIKLHLIFFKVIKPTSRDPNYTVYAGNQNGLMVEIEIPHQLIDQWSGVFTSDSFLKEIVITDLLFISVKSESKYSFFGSFFYRYYPNFVSDQRDSFSISTFRVSPTSVCYTRSTQNQTFTYHYLPNKIGTIGEVFDALAKSLVTYDSELDYYQRISLKGRVIFIDDRKKNKNIISIYLVDSMEESSEPQHNIGIKFQDYRSDILDNIKIGDFIVANDCSIEFPYKWKPILLVDKFSHIEIEQSSSNADTDMAVNQQQIQIYDSSNDETTQMKSTKILKHIKDFIPLSNKNLNENIFRLYYQYQFILNFKGKVIDCKRDNIVYRGCKQCHSPVSPFPAEHLIENNHYTTEKLFCSNCRSIVNSLLLVKLKLRIKLFNYDSNNNIIEFNEDDNNEDDETIVILKIDSNYCRNILNFPIEHGYAQQYQEQLNQLVGKNIYFSGISTPKVNYKNEIHLFINCISEPIFN
ncbi:hypothetical protein DICPUDRAFT_33662 [Dictyostelium purpureum]|uniref:Uncharacterized protein n=1 Tax=Dictyostelium purpureum TaxID=5786 RepID=F0ZLA0_DICPU|nr:uncharacterized protein DICPUDRAFT_33662 [Dictyostelium purpureum]EGC35264.1 hypothetical protein DICPUDRAFT_33662 [Dictyostelium purpureum]|eukprot:XP_003288190.1 hypothetical protein DICPUDRAFT_33662 [Dictyostelium purpureum]